LAVLLGAAAVHVLTAGALGVLVFCLGGYQASRANRFRELRADVRGLVEGSGATALRAPWSAVRGMERRHWQNDSSPELREVVVSTTAGEMLFSLSDPGAEAMEAGIRRVLAAREAGYALPSRAPVSDAALSPVRLDGEAEAERGLSRAGGGGGEA
jgi:hypothetical protein